MQFLCKRKKKTRAFYLPVNVVSQEQIIGVRGISALVKMSQQIFVLSVDITADVYRTLQFYEHRLLQENLPGFVTELSDLGFRQLNLFRTIENFFSLKNKWSGKHSTRDCNKLCVPQKQAPRSALAGQLCARDHKTTGPRENQETWKTWKFHLSLIWFCVKFCGFPRVLFSFNILSLYVKAVLRDCAWYFSLQKKSSATDKILGSVRPQGRSFVHFCRLFTFHISDTLLTNFCLKLCIKCNELISVALKQL